MSDKPFLPYAHQSIDDTDIAAVEKALRGDWITRGPQVSLFEKEFAAYCGAKFAVAFSSGSAALSAAYFAAETGPYDRIITTPNTFISTVGGALQQGATPVFVDIDRASGNLNIEQLAYNANLPTSRGKAILVPVHFSGIPVEMEKLERLIEAPNTIVIEDGAHAIGSSYSIGGPKVGSCAFSQMTIFSLHPAKTITSGEGGVVTTNDENYHHRLRLFRNNGLEHNLAHIEYEGYYEVSFCSNNYNFTEFQAALAFNQLQRIDLFIEKRRELVRAYREKLKDEPHITLFTDHFDQKTAFHIFVIQIDFASLKISRKEVMAQLKNEGIGTQVHYIPLYKHPCIKKLTGEISSYFPEMENYFEKALTLPLYPEMTLSDIDKVVQTLKHLLTPR